MPNHITNEITGPAAIKDALTRPYTPEERQAQIEDQEHARAFWAEKGKPELFIPRVIPEDARVIDFGLLIPEPDNIEVGGCSGHHEPGVVCWYEWNRDNWGTKWNGYDLEITEQDDIVTLRFDTAWSHPYPVVEKLSKRFPDDELHVRYADEDLGSNLGEYTIKDDERGGDTAPTDPRGALDFAAQLKYGKTYKELSQEWGEEDEDDDA